MRTLIAALAVALLPVTAQAQTAGKPRKPPETAQKREDVEKKKALDRDYKNALKNIPAVTEKPDPWKTMR